MTQAAGDVTGMMQRHFRDQGATNRMIWQVSDARR